MKKEGERCCECKSESPYDNVHKSGRRQRSGTHAGEIAVVITRSSLAPDEERIGGGEAAGRRETSICLSVVSSLVPHEKGKTKL
jgi:hypothetical protein